MQEFKIDQCKKSSDASMSSINNFSMYCMMFNNLVINFFLLYLQYENDRNTVNVIISRTIIISTQQRLWAFFV